MEIKLADFGIQSIVDYVGNEYFRLQKLFGCCVFRTEEKDISISKELYEFVEA